MVGNPANTNAYIAMKSAPSLPRENFTAMLRLDHNRALSASRRQDRHQVGEIEKLTVWGNHSPTMYADYRFATINGKAVKDMINDQVWNADVFLPTVGKRGAAIIEARGLSSAASAANAAIDHMRDWALGTNGKWVTMGVPSNGEYGIPKDVMFGFPVTTEDGEYKIVEGLPIDDFSQERINKTLKELTDEQAGVKHLLLSMGLGPRMHPRDILLGAQAQTGFVPVCDHYSGVEARMRKSLQLQAEMTEEFGACVFDVTLDCEDGAPVGGEAEHAALVVALALLAGQKARVAVRVHPVDHPAFEQDIATIAGKAGSALCHIMVPKVESVQDVERACEALDAAGAGAVAAACADRVAGAVHRAFEIAAHPRVQSLSFGLMDFVSAHGGAIPSEGHGHRGPVHASRWWCAPSWRSPRPATRTARCRRMAW